MTERLRDRWRGMLGLGLACGALVGLSACNGPREDEDKGQPPFMDYERAAPTPATPSTDSAPSSGEATPPVFRDDGQH